MFHKLAFKYYSESRKIAFLREEGIMLGARQRHGQKVYLYMLKDFFVEVIYEKDDIDLEPIKLETFTSLDNLNAYLEKEFKTAF
ncbi:MAG: hypothetical protein DI538_02025 [Azospira oryzae]|jgi:hypothetical protein|nr:hypothetical protein [Cytophaga sp.]PZR41257.1 MAG: hypothetical protein DI538_02025 [Azospira oryzae]